MYPSVMDALISIKSAFDLQFEWNEEQSEEVTHKKRNGCGGDSVKWRNSNEWRTDNEDVPYRLNGKKK